MDLGQYIQKKKCITDARMTPNKVPCFQTTVIPTPLSFNVPKNIYKYIYTFFHDAIYKHVFLSAENEAIL